MKLWPWQRELFQRILAAKGPLRIGGPRRRKPGPIGPTRAEAERQFKAITKAIEEDPHTWT